jgi:hypothetical protein
MAKSNKKSAKSKLKTKSHIKRTSTQKKVIQTEPKQKDIRSTQSAIVADGVMVDDSKKSSRPPVALSSVWELSRKSVNLLLNNKKLFVGIALIYGLLDLILANSWASKSSVSQLKTNLLHAFSGHAASVASSIDTFIKLGSTSNNSSNTAGGVYQFFLVLFASLATIWALRQVTAGHTVKIRYAYYRGMYPLVPFVVTLMLIGLELLPLILGALLYTIGIDNGIVIGSLQKMIFLVIFGGLTLVSLFMMAGSIIALYTVTEPDMTPRQASHAAARLVRQIRWVVIRKMMFLLFVLLIIAAIIMIPITLWVTPLAGLIYFLLSILAVPVIHSYMYTLYQELLIADD